MFKSGGNAGQTLRNLIVEKLSEPITLTIRAMIDPILNVFKNDGRGGEQGGLWDGLTKAFDKVTGGFDKIGSEVSGTMTKAGDWLAKSSNGSISKVGEGLKGFSQVAGKFAKGFADFATGMKLNKLISDGFSMGKAMDKFQTAATAVASVFGKGFGSIVGAVSGVVNRLFGLKLKDSGIQGNFGQSGFSGESYQFFKGGLFRSDKTKTSALDSDMSIALGNQFGALKSSVSGMASALGMATSDIEAYTYQMKVSFQGLNEEAINQRLAEEFAKMGDGMAKLAPGLEIYRRAGESASEALTRLYGYYVNEKQAEIAILNAQGKRIEALNMQRKLELALLDDVEKASKQRIYALEDEVYAATEAASLRKQVDDLTLTSTQLRAKERDGIVSSNQALFDYVTALEKADEAQDGLVAALDDLISRLDTVAEDFKRITESLSAFSVQLSTGPAAQLSPQAKYLSTKSALDVNQAKALTGDKAALEAVESLSNEFLEASKEYFASGSAYFSDLDKVKGMVRTATDVAKAQELAAIDARTDAQKQLDALGEVRTSVDSVEDATRAVQAAVIQLSKASALETYSTMVASGASPLSAYTQASGSINASSMPTADKTAALTSLKEVAATDSSSFALKTYNTAVQSGKTVLQAATEAQQYLQNSSAVLTTTQMATAFAPIKTKALESASVSDALKAQIRAAEAAENAAFAKLGYAYAGGFSVDASGKPVWSSQEMNGQSRWATRGGFAWNETLGAFEGPAALAAMRGGSPAQWNDYFASYGSLPAPAGDPNAPWNLLDTLSKQYNTELNTQKTAIGALKFANGGAFTNGVVDTPTRFNMGLMGEAGPEAIMPLTRMADGSLGVAYSGQQSNAELVAEIRALRAEVAEMKQHTAAGVRVAQAVGKAQIQNLETIAEAATDTAHNQRLAELSR